MTKQDIKFTVIIPTRERSDTLKWALKTCATQDYDNLEIIVSDNFSQDDTRVVVESYQDKRIKYINTGKRVSMSSNWEFALSHVEIDPQRYVTVLGDDDGLLPNALQDLNILIQKLGEVEAIAWRKPCYYWKNSILNPNLLSISFKKNLEKIDTKKALKETINSSPSSVGFSYQRLPCLYNSFVKSTKIDIIRKKSGKFVHSMIPDVYSAIALSTIIDSHYLSYKPYSISGISRHSSGVSMSGKTSKEKESIVTFMNEANIPFHEELVFSPSIHIIVIESVLQVRDHLKLDIEINFEDVVATALDESIGSNKYIETLNSLNEIAKKHDLKDNWYSNNLEFTLRKSLKMLKINLFNVLGLFSKNRFTSILFLMLGKGVHLNGSRMGIENIYDAALWHHYIAENGKREDKIDYALMMSILLSPKNHRVIN